MANIGTKKTTFNISLKVVFGAQILFKPAFLSEPEKHADGDEGH
jgi:hypothetical protein